MTTHHFTRSRREERRAPLVNIVAALDGACIAMTSAVGRASSFGIAAVMLLNRDATRKSNQSSGGNLIFASGKIDSLNRV